MKVSGCRWWHRRVANLGVAAIAGAVVLAGGCSTARSSLGTTASPCFVALPAASAAVGHRGHLAGVRSVRWDDVALIVDRGPGSLDVHRPPPQHVCLVAFTGHFTRGSVDHPVGRSTAPLALVLVAWPKDRVIGTVLARHARIRLGHPRVGA